MNHQLIKRFALVLFAQVTFLFAKGQSPERPNILWITSEDNSKHFMALYEKGGAEMPNLAQLAKKSVVFNHAFSNAPVCSVARSTVISGCYAPRIGTQYHRRMAQVPMPEGLQMFPAYLREAGYYTTNNAKEDYNITKAENVWDFSSKEAHYRNRQINQPFFHVQNFGKTHEGQLHFDRQTAQNALAENQFQDITPFPYHPNTPLFRYTYHHYYQLHQSVDEQIGKFLKQVEEDGLMDNTIIFYFGDHGGVLPGSKGYVYESGLHVPLVVYFPPKWQHLAPAKPGTRFDGFVEFVDLAPTVLNLAGIPIPKGLDGLAFAGQNINAPKRAKKRTTLGYADRFDEKYDLVRTVRKGQFKYIRNFQPFNIDGLQNNYRYRMLAYQEWRDLFYASQLNETQARFFQAKPAEALYDLSQDPHETNNLAGNPAYAKTLKQLRRALMKRLKGMPDLSFLPEPYFLENGLQNPVAFGQSQKSRIADLIDVANLQLMTFEKAAPKIIKALQDKDPWARYWGLIVCSHFKENAQDLVERITKMGTSDPENLVKMRAAEFLGLIQQKDADLKLVDCLKSATSETEANLILNSVALLHDLKLSFDVALKPEMVDPAWLENPRSNVSRRFQYITGNLD